MTISNRRWKMPIKHLIILSQNPVTTCKSFLLDRIANRGHEPNGHTRARPVRHVPQACQNGAETLDGNKTRSGWYSLHTSDVFAVSLKWEGTAPGGVQGGAVSGTGLVSDGARVEAQRHRMPARGEPHADSPVLRGERPV